MNQAFQVLAFKGSETIDQPFFIEVQWVSENPAWIWRSYFTNRPIWILASPVKACTGKSTALAGKARGSG